MKKIAWAERDLRFFRREQAGGRVEPRALEGPRPQPRYPVAVKRHARLRCGDPRPFLPRTATAAAELSRAIRAY